MAEPIDSAAFLEDVSALAQTQYFPELLGQYPGRFGINTNKWFKPAEKVAVGTGITVQVEVAPADSARFTDDVLSAIAAPDTLDPASVTIRFNKTDATANDFSRVSASVQTSEYDIQEAGRGAIVDFVERVYRNVKSDFEEKLAIHRNLARTSLLALVNGTPTQNDHRLHASATATASNTAGVRFPIDNGSIARFRRGSRIDVVSAAGVVRATNIRVTDVNTQDDSIGCEFVSTGITARQSTGNVANIADDDEIFFSGERNKGIYSVGAWFTMPAATGDSFIGGLNRQSQANRWMVPTVTREGVASAQVTTAMFNDLAIAMGYKDEAGIGGILVSDPKVHQRLRGQIGEDAFIQNPIDASRMKRFAHFGNIGLMYQHPTFGLIQVTADPLMPNTTVRFLVPETWRTYYYASKGLQPIRENGGHWYRLNENTPNTGKGLIWKADWFATLCDFCHQPYKNGAILNITN